MAARPLLQPSGKSSHSWLPAGTGCVRARKRGFRVSAFPWHFQVTPSPAAGRQRRRGFCFRSPLSKISGPLERGKSLLLPEEVSPRRCPFPKAPCERSGVRIWGQAIQRLQSGEHLAQNLAGMRAESAWGAFGHGFVPDLRADPCHG